MNKGVEILIERMSSNPDEFLPIEPYGNLPAKWGDIIGAMFARKQKSQGDAPFYDLPFISDEDVEAFHTKLNTLRGDHFTKCVMSTLLTDDSSDKEGEMRFTQNSLADAIRNMNHNRGNKIVMGDTQAAYIRQLMDSQLLASKPGAFSRGKRK